MGMQEISYPRQALQEKRTPLRYIQNPKTIVNAYNPDPLNHSRSYRISKRAKLTKKGDIRFVDPGVDNADAGHRRRRPEVLFTAISGLTTFLHHFLIAQRPPGTHKIHHKTADDDYRRCSHHHIHAGHLPYETHTDYHDDHPIRTCIPHMFDPSTVAA